ncbi:MAG: hypothetical protein ABJA66_17165, partial [Actinomycetota bacterium]
RKNDGKNVSPSTNLLPQKSKDDDEEDRDDDEDKDDDTSVNVNKINKEINKSVKSSQKEVAIAMKNSQKDMEQAQKEMEKIKPELVKINTEAIQAKIDEGLKIQKEAMARVAEANFFPGSPVIEKKDETFTVKGTPKVTIDAKNCAVSVRGWDRQEVQYFITRISKRRTQKPLEFTADHSDSEVKIIVNGGKDSDDREFFNEADRVRVEVFVPKKSNLRIRTDREIRLENVSGDIDLKGVDESINVRDVDGKLRIASTDGRIRVIGFTGEIESQTADGDMSLEGNFQKITATTTGDGKIILTLPDDASAIIRANTKSVCLDGIAPSKIKTVDISDESSVWRIGNGSANYNFNVTDGEIFIRSISDLKAGL